MMMPCPASRPAKSSWLTAGWRFKRASRTRAPIMFLFVALLVFFMACDFHTLDFYLVRASNVCDVHTISAGLMPIIGSVDRLEKLNK
jgi:hypothetical protein